ncbi:MerR family transcriptional regulator [Catenuloplanes atrovinosus]|uniref:Protein phosphatase n=1 Tax=Catenuloplanes atrovinosus TaxID=137266 RepID=A0AAE4C9X2_9ACTN|nr:MerR family transcriptional regulator [Catenuloplanes atrovinosus]MDR7274035.1 protein phosphatase [Catenuloplanes atrovinosus]
MGLLTIGAFARLSRLSPKALRLYDDLGLLPPAAVDPSSGYRLYDPAQLERARLVAWLRRLGMPLARIRDVCALPPDEAAHAVAAFRDRIAAEAQARERLATFLVDYLSGRGSPMSDQHIELGIRYAARTDTGRGRDTNEDAVYAGSRLLAVADGMRGPLGRRASATAIEALRPLEDADLPAGALLNALSEAIGSADSAIRSADDPQSLTTLTALLWSGSQLALVHIGDSRAYLLREDALFRITTDHTYVQTLVDEGRLTPEEARSHPERALLVRALGHDATADLSLHTAEPGDRYLLCSDGLSAVVDPAALESTLRDTVSPADTVDRLIALAYDSGAPDNIACVVADVVAV